MENKPITVTSPLLPDLEELIPLLQDIWDSKWITNMGQYHQKLEKALCEYLGVKYISIFTNGTLPLITALQAMEIKGEVITTPYSFVATTHAIKWNGLTPVFVDIDPITCNIDPDAIEAAITERTTAIMPVHVYGTPCDVERIQQIADKHHLKVIYDAAHAFGVTLNGESILNAGDMSTLSFHATKVFNTIEGGALICPDAATKIKIDHLKNFGFEDEVSVVGAGINSKIDEVRAAYGLINLKQVDQSICRRKEIVEFYVKEIEQIEGISCINTANIFGDKLKSNYAYFPIFVDEDTYGMSRDALYQKMKDNKVLGRRYFYPLISSFDDYKDLPSSSENNLPISTKIADQVICLPLYQELETGDLERIINLIKK